MTEENDKKDLKNVRDKIQENLKKILNSDFEDESTFYSPWGHYETLGKVDVVDEWKQESPMPYYIHGIFEEMMGKNERMWNGRGTHNCEDISLLGKLLEEYKNRERKLK